MVAPVTLTSLFPAPLFNATGTLQTQASAVAGFGQAICKNTPIFVCNGASGGANDMMNPQVMKGKEVSLVGAPGNSYSPGNYGFLDINCGNNTPCLNQALGKNDTGKCIDLSSVTTTTGQKTASAAYFNTRFDLYQTDANNADPTLYSPDANVRKGFMPQGCNKTASDGGWGPPPAACELPLPDDSNITPANYSTATIGNGNWTGNFNTYWATNFPTAPQPATPATRFGLYQCEMGIGSNCSNVLSTQSKHSAAPCNKNNTGGEVGTPTCVSPNDAQADRRILYAAVIDCSQLGGGQTTVTPLGVVKFFLLQPSQPTGGFGTLLAEYVDVALPNNTNAAVLHDIVQLYR